MNKNLKIGKLFIIWFIMGMIYFTVEGIWRMPKGEYANISMLLVGGLCGLLVGGINQIPCFYHMKIWKQSAIGTVLVLIAEYISGYILNIKMGLNIWDYSNFPFNLNGQICLHFALIWYLLMPAAIWLEDFIRSKFWNEDCEYSLKNIYFEWLFFK